MAAAVKKHAKEISNFSCPVQFYWISLVCSKYFAQDCRLILLLPIPAFFCKNSSFFSKIVPLLKAVVWKFFCGKNSDFLVMFSVFVRHKVTINERISFTDYASGIRLPGCSKFAVNGKNGNDVTVFQHDAIVKFFWRYYLLPS